MPRPHPRLYVVMLAGGLCGACTGLGALVDLGTAEPELLLHVEEIRQAEIALRVVDDFLPCGDEASAKASADPAGRVWDGPSCFARIGWAPSSTVRSGYFVTVSPDGSDFTVVGLADTDGDGSFQRVEASLNQGARVVSPAEVR